MTMTLKPKQNQVPVMTTFYKDLQTLQKRYYMHLRASIVLYMDDKARDYYITRIQQEDIRKDLPMSSKYEPGQRISWQWIKNMYDLRGNVLTYKW